MSRALLEARALRFSYPDGPFALALDALRIEAGERIACIGPSGCGKTTLVHLLAGILSPHAGEVELDGVAFASLPEAARRARRIRSIGLVFQEFELLEYLSARENLLLPYHLSPALSLDASALDRAERLAAATGIAALLDRKPGRLSQGERQRLALCRALVTEPLLLLGDEPTGNLDPDNARGALDLLFEQAEAAGAALFLVTHDHEILPRFDRVVDLRDALGRAD